MKKAVKAAVHAHEAFGQSRKLQGTFKGIIGDIQYIGLYRDLGFRLKGS